MKAERSVIKTLFMSDSVGKRIRQARLIRAAHTGAAMSQKDLAEACGWEDGQSRVSNYENDSRNASPADIELLAAALKVSPVWLMFGGEGGPEMQEGKERLGELLQKVSKIAPNPISVPVLDNTVGLGPGSESVEYREIEAIPVPERFLLEMGAKDPGAVRGVYTSGNSMYPEIADGELSLIDTTPVLHPEGLIAIDSGTGIRIKQVAVRTDGSVAIISKNPDKDTYPTEEYDQDAAAELFRFVGTYLGSYLKKRR